MTKTIEANTLRDWLEAHQPVVVLDVRSDEDRAQWAIPGGVHLNAYQALRAGQPGALATAILPHDRPVVTVCNAGRVSQPNFVRIVELNESGEGPDIDPTELEAGANRCAVR
jgi:rhodanese-related sulfurtransferase